MATEVADTATTAGIHPEPGHFDRRTADDMVQSQDPILIAGGFPQFAGPARDPLGLVDGILDGKYRVEAVEAFGGASIVYRAIHLPWGRPVAIKAFQPPAHLAPAQRSQLLEGFLREGAISAELSECSLAVRQARDAGSAVTRSGERVPYLVLEWLDGEPLDLWLAARRAACQPLLSLFAAMELVSPVAAALSIAHDRGICHLDVKPGNVFVLGADREPPAIKLIDFGVAKVLGRAGNLYGEVAQLRSFTPDYGAPEQFDTGLGPTGPWTDVFAQALMLVELVTGHAPLIGDRPEEMARAAADPRDRPTPRARGARVSDSVERVFSRALAVDPLMRFATAGGFWRALESAACDGPSAPLPLRRARARAESTALRRETRGGSPPQRRPGQHPSRMRVRVVRTVAMSLILATVSLGAACIAKQLGWNVSVDAAPMVRHLVLAAERRHLGCATTCTATDRIPPSDP
jgi:serine/threonine protein kinase